MPSVYVNTFAEGAEIGTPEEIDERALPMIAKTWKRSHAVAHYELFGIETVEWKGISKEFLIGDIGSARILLPVDEEFSALGSDDRPETLFKHRIAAVVEDFDLNDEGNPVLILNRKKALARLQELNAKRIVQGGRAYGVIQGNTRGAYLMNVAGYKALMPRYWYDWDSSKRGRVGEGFEVEIRMTRNDGIIVSRCHLMSNPLDRMKIGRGARVQAKITHIYRGAFQAEIRPGIPIRIQTPTMFHVPHIGDHVMVEVRSKGRQCFNGVVV